MMQRSDWTGDSDTMKKFILLAAALGLLVATGAAADQTQTKGSSQMSGSSMEKDASPKLGHKTWKERVNTVARKPLEHDIKWLDSRDRTGWNGYTVWQGIRDERPMIARKTMGYHEPRPHKTRRERVTTISRGPIQGPGFAQ
jgi:hypothetical protein